MTEILTEHAREELVTQALAAASKKDKVRNERINWRDDGLLLPVVKLPLEATVLNPGSHRISSEIEALGDKAEPITRDPYGAEAQKMIASILRSTQGFEGIKTALDRDKQLHPGVATCKGVLVNANTRRVALEDLGNEYIDVVVLPSDASEKEITDLELDLQMQMDVKQEYSFTARLVFISRLVLDRGMSAEEVGLKLNPSLPTNAKGKRDAKKMVEQELRLHRLIRDIVDASDGAIGITKFDGDRQVLIEIDQDYEKARKSDPVTAQRVRDAQLACLIAGVRYTKMRKVDDELVTGYLTDAMKDQKTLRPFVEDLLAAPETMDAGGDDPGGLGILDDMAEEVELSGPDTGRLFNVLVTAPEDSDISLRNTDGEDVEIPRQTVLASINQAFMIAIDAKDRDNKDSDRLDAPAQKLRDVARLLDDAATGYAEVNADPDFDDDEFQDAMGAAQRAWDAFTMVQAD